MLAPTSSTYLLVIVSLHNQISPSWLRLNCQISSHSKVTSFLSWYSLRAPSTLSPEHVPWRRVYLCDYPVHVYIPHLTVGSRRTVTPLLVNRNTIRLKKKWFFRNLVTENYEISVFDLWNFNVLLHFFFITISEY